MAEGEGQREGVLLVAAAAAVVAALVLASRGQQLQWWQQGWTAHPKAASGLAMGVGSCGWQGCSGGAGEEEDRRDGERKREKRLTCRAHRLICGAHHQNHRQNQLRG